MLLFSTWEVWKRGRHHVHRELCTRGYMYSVTHLLLGERPSCVWLRTGTPMLASLPLNSCITLGKSLNLPGSVSSFVSHDNSASLTRVSR